MGEEEGRREKKRKVEVRRENNMEIAEEEGRIWEKREEARRVEGRMDKKSDEKGRRAK